MAAETSVARYYEVCHRTRDDVSGAVDSTQAATPGLDLTVSRRRACQSDIHEPPWEGGGVTVERGNLLNSKRCSGSRPLAAGNTHTITPPLRREWALNCQGLPAPPTDSPPVPQRYADGGARLAW